MEKICFVTTVPLTLRAFVIDTAKYLHAQGGYDISFICDNDPDFAASLPEYIHYHPVPMKRGISLGGIGAMLKMYRIFRTENFDLVQYSTPNASLYASIAAWLAGVPVRLYCQWGIAYVGFSGMKRRIFKLVEKTVCRLSTRIEPDSFGNLHFSQAEGLYTPKKSGVVWNGSASGVNLSKFDIAQKEGWRKAIRRQYELPEDAFVYGFVGRVNRDKGINELLAAFQSVQQSCPGSYLMLVGREEVTPSMNAALYNWAKNNPHVLFCGFTNVVEQYLSAMDVYILPSYREGFGSGVIEAEAMGVPVIITNIPGPTDAMLKNETGLVIQKADIYDLQAAMETLYCDSEIRWQYGQSGVSFAKTNFDQQVLFAHILTDRENLMGKR
jgi:glycosyltransferase involved in cell wall biosynthesis